MSSLEKPDYYKVARFFIKEFHLAENQTNYFTYQNVPFVYVYFLGTVISKSTHNNKLSFKVNDGVATITCLVEENFLTKIEEQKKKYDQFCQIKGDKDSAVYRACQMTYMATKYLTKNLPSSQDINLGDMVAIIGKLTEHNGTRYVFVNKIRIAEATDFLDNTYYRFDSIPCGNE